MKPKYLLGVHVWACVCHVSLAGPLTPLPDPVSSTTGPEPRIAINDTNTPGDSDSVYRITSPGSYYLTENVVGVEFENGIVIAASNVTIDLNGFTMRGIPTSTHGIYAESGVKAISVRNGVVAGWTDGVNLVESTECVVEDVSAHRNFRGIAVGSFAIVSGCRARLNTSFAIHAIDDSRVIECVVRDNASTGIFAESRTSIVSCTVAGNEGQGLSVGIDSEVRDCSISENAAFGATLGDRSSITDCTVATNASGIYMSSGSRAIGCMVYGNDDEGVWVGSHCVLERNQIDANGGIGIYVEWSDNTVMHNTIRLCGEGVRVEGTGNVLGRNTCSRNDLNWNVGSSNSCLVVAGVDGPAISGDAGGVSLGSSDPLANFTY